MTHPPLRMGGREWLLLAALSVLWGGSFFFYKVLVDAHLPPFTVVLGRVGLAAVALNALLLARRDPMPASWRLWGQFLVLGLINNVIPFSLFVFAEAHIASGLAAILNATTPIFTVLAAHVLTRNETLTPGKTVGVLFGFLGAAVLIGPKMLQGLGGADLPAEAACLVAAATYAFATLYGRRFRGLPPLKVATGQVTASTAILVPMSLLADRPWLLPAPGPAAWAALAGLALLSTALAFLIYFHILAVAGATNLALVTFLIPVSALLLGALFLGESISLQAVAGMALIGAGLSALDGRPWQAARRRLWPKASPG